MKIIKTLLIISITLIISFKANSSPKIINSLKEGGKLIFIRHAYAPGNGDPKNFSLDDCATQRNLNQKGKLQSKKIGLFFKDNLIQYDKILSSEWCRCKDTAFLAFKSFEEKLFLNSFYDERFSKNKEKQIKNLKNYVKNLKGNQNLIFVTHYVVIYELLDINTLSGEIVVSDRNFNLIGKVKIGY